jgi:signal transduction histidine kinase
MTNEDLIKENQKLKEVVALKSNLIAMTAHDLRTGAVALKWVLKMMIDKDTGPVNDEQLDLLKKAFERNERNIDLIGEFISANQSEDATISYKFAPADALLLLESVISDFSAAAFKLGVNVSYKKPTKGISRLKMDEAKIRVVFSNLIDNAIKYSKKGGAVDIAVRPDGNFVEFSVKDSGIGIRPEDKDKIFSKFFRSQDAKMIKTVGTGLGITTIKEIVEKHGGKVWFTSLGADQGTTFYFTLPI